MKENKKMSPYSPEIPNLFEKTYFLLLTHGPACAPTTDGVANLCSLRGRSF